MDTGSSELNTLVGSMMGHVRSLAPDVQVRFNPAVYEDERANIDVLPPLDWNDERCLDLQEEIGVHVVDMLIETGYLIGVYVFTPEQQLAEAGHKTEQTDQVPTWIDSLEPRQPAVMAAD